MIKIEKHNIKITIFSIFVSFIIILFPRIAFASGFSDTICSMITDVTAFIADGIVYLCDALDGKFDKLIFNYDGNTFNADQSLILLQNTTISKQILSVYFVMRYISISIIVAISGWITLDFMKAGNEPRHKAILKSRLQLFVVSIILLYGMPKVVDLMLVFNSAFADIFRLISKSFIQTNGTIDFSKSFLTATFKGLMDKATGKEALILAIAYLTSSLINFWLIIFYMIRDIAIAFLFIFAPILISILPYRVDLIVNWFKEMFSNIFTQAIQAVVFTVLVAIISGLTNQSDLKSDVFALVAFAMFIPITAMVKHMLGLEGQIGAAKSTAGLGAAVMGMAFAGKAISGIKNKAGMLKESHDRINDLKTERDNLNKPRNTGSSPLPNYNNNGMSRGNRFGNFGMAAAALGGLEGSVGEMGTGMAMATMFTGGGARKNFMPNSSSNGMPRNRDTITGEINSIRKQAFKSIASGALGTMGGGIGAIAGSALGPMGAMIGMQTGSSVGDFMGSVGADIASYTGSALSETAQDGLFGKGIRPELVSLTNGNKNWMTNSVGNMKNMGNNLKNNAEAIKSDMKYSSAMKPIAAYGKALSKELTPVGDGNKEWNLENIKHNMQNMSSNIKGNLNSVKSSLDESWMNKNFKPELEELEIQKQARQDGITGLTGDPLRNTEYYSGEKDSIIETQKLVRQGKFAKASRYRLQTSSPSYNTEAINNLETSKVTDPSCRENAMLYTDKNASILFQQNSETGERQVLATYEGNQNLETPTMESVSFNANGDIPVSEAQRSEYQEKAVNLAITRYGADSVNNENNNLYHAAQSYIEKETNNLINQHVSRNENLRHNSGNQRIVINGSVRHENVATYNSVPNNIDNIEINVPDNLNTQYAKDVHQNVQASNYNIDKKQLDFIRKQEEYKQQQQYTNNLVQGANEIHYRTHNSASNDSRL